MAVVLVVLVVLPGTVVLVVLVGVPGSVVVVVAGGGGGRFDIMSGVPWLS